MREMCELLSVMTMYLYGLRRGASDDFPLLTRRWLDAIRSMTMLSLMSAIAPSDVFDLT
jgi:hypothetical protein